MNLSFCLREQSEEYKRKITLTEDEEKIFDMLTKNFSVVKIARYLEKNMGNENINIESISAGKMKISFDEVETAFPSHVGRGIYPMAGFIKRFVKDLSIYCRTDKAEDCLIPHLIDK